MELQCPGCLKRLTIPDPFAGQMVKCPLCAGMFVAPALPAKPVTVAPIVPVAAPVAVPIAPAMPQMELPIAPPTPASHPDVIPFSSEPLVVPPMPPMPPLPYTPPPPPPRHVDVESDPVPHGDHTSKRTVVLRPHVLRWVTPCCLAAVFLLSFFDWKNDGGQGQMNLWGMAFHSDGPGRYVAYIVFTLFLALPLAWVKLSFEKNWLPMPAALAPFWPWRSVIVGGLLLLAFVVPFFDALQWNLTAISNPMSLGMKLAIRAHLVAIIASGLEYWLLTRAKAAAPLPDLTIRW